MRPLLTFISIVLLLGIENCNVKEEIDKLFIGVSGNVSENGEAVVGALVLLITSPSIADGVMLSNGSITDANGNYTIFNVDDGDYYVVAIDDVNDNFQYDSDTDRFGFHGVDLTALNIDPDQITVAGEDVDNIDVTYLTGL